MVNSSWSYSILFYDRSASWASTIITTDCDEIPIFTDSSDKKINTGIVMVNANNGKHINNGTLFDFNDRISISVNDGASGAYIRYFDIVSKIPIKTKGSGTKLKLELEGIERWLRKVNYSKRIFNETPSNILIDIINVYNSNKGSDMPFVTIGVNQLPTTHHIQMDFGVNEDKCFDRIFELLDKMASSGNNGGVLDFYDARFVTTGVNAITLNVFSSGSPSTGSEVTINSTNVNTGDSDAGLDEAEANVIHSWGAIGYGSLPIEFSKFKSRQIIMPTVFGSDSQFPTHVPGSAYLVGSIVVAANNLIYKKTTTSPAIQTPPGSTWTQLTTETYYGGVIRYSPWTDDKATLWKNSGCNPSGAGGGPFGVGFWDGNLIINDDTTFRTWVDLSSTTSLLNTFWLYNISLSGLYDGLRVLVKGTGTGSFAGHNNAIMEYTNGAWREKYPARTNMQVCVLDEAKIYMYGNDGSGSGATQWWNITDLDNGADCLHTYTSISNTESVLKNTDIGSQFIGNNVNSAISVIYDWNPTLCEASKITSDRKNSNYYQSGAWLNIRFPFPRNSNNGISEQVGDIYGGGTQGTSVKAPNAIDAQNMHYTHDGLRGWNKGISSEDYGQLSSIDFFMKIKYEGTTIIPHFLLPTANHKMRCWMFDKSDHVVSQDFVLTHNDNWQSVSLPLSGFEIYRGRRPKYDNKIVNTLVPPKDLSAPDQFEFRHIVQICWGTIDSYDNFGRYDAALGDFGIGLILALTGRRITLSIDGLRFAKPLLVNTLTDIDGGNVAPTDLIKEGEPLERPDITNYYQLKQDAFAELERARYENKSYDIETTGKFDIDFGDFFLFNDIEIVDMADTAAKTIKLVAKHIEYSITKPIDGRGGFLRRIRGSRRFV